MALKHATPLTYEKILNFINSKQGFRLARDIAAAGQIRLITIKGEAPECEVIAFVHSTHTKKTWYRVCCKLSHDAILSCDCVCLGRSVWLSAFSSSLLLLSLAHPLFASNTLNNRLLILLFVR